MSGNFRNQASIALNILLAIIIIALVADKLGRASTPPIANSDAGKTAAMVDSGKKTIEVSAFVEPLKFLQYADFNSPSDRRRTIIDQLRAMGAPNDFLALVAKVDFEAQWDSRFDECKGDMDKLAAVQLAMNMNKDAEMRAALGEAGFRQWDQKTVLWEAMSTSVETTTSEAAAIYGLKKKLQQTQYDLEKARLNGTMDDAQINAASDKAYAEYFQQMKGLLGDDRYKKSQQLDDDFVAGNLRAQLAQVNPNDSQFQELFKAEQELNNSRLELDHQFESDPSSKEYQAQLKALNEARDQAYQHVLGSNAFYALQQQQDPGYTQMKKYADLWGLDDSKINYVYETLKNYEKSLQEYQAQLVVLQIQGQGVDLDTVRSHLQQVTDKTQQALQNYLGQEGFNKLQRNRVFQFNQSPSLHSGPS
jgi:hypothetical protein